MSNAEEGFWCPNLVNSIKTFLRRGILPNNTLSHHSAFLSNIAYNLQYIEFLNYQLTEKDLHSTVRTQTQKSFVITGMSIIEAILWYVLRKHGAHKIEEWERISESETASFRDGTTEFRVRNTILKKREKAIEIEMPLETMIRRVEKKKLLGVEHQVYRDLNFLRKLRNKVHIHSVQHDRDTDWYTFNNKEVKLMKKVLLSVLSSELFKPEKEHERILEYLMVKESAEQLADSIHF